MADVPNSRRCCPAAMRAFAVAPLSVRDAVVVSAAAATDTVPLLHGLLLSRHYPFGIAVVITATATADANNNGNVTACQTYSSSKI
jgi:hypothetical protein